MTNILQCCAFNYKQFLIDEIALDGLSGITCNQLWKRMEKRISAPVTDKMKARFWRFISNCDSVSFYEIPEPVRCIEILDRFMIVEEFSGHLTDPEDYLDGPYEYCNVENEFGSCSNYYTRKEISKEKLKGVSYETVAEKYPDTMVIVASSEERWKALAPHIPETVRAQLTPVHYCILELVGKARENGQMTVGKTNLTKIIKEPKFLFYNRKHLQSLDLLRVACLTLKMAGKGIKSLILRLKRFHQPSILSMPKTGKLHNVKEYLMKQPDYSEKTEVIISKGLLTQQNSRKLQKTVNVFKFEEKLIPTNTINKKGRPVVAVKRRYISLVSKSDESSQSEDEDGVALECQYNVGVDLLRQAYERLLDAGRKGLTQIELSQLLGVEFYTSRSICRIFRARHIIREYLEDKGKQRTARYYAVAAANSEMDQKYEEERNKLLEYMKTTKSEMENTEKVSSDEDEIPLKKIKMSKEADLQATTQATTSNIIENEVTEIKMLEGLDKFNNESLLNSKKSPTLRQLKFANGLIKITREKLAISGYHTLSSLVSKETGEPPLDTKAFKIFVQKLVTDGQVKLMKIKWPTAPNKYSILICAPHVKCTDPIIKLKQREVSIRAFTNNKVKKETVEPPHRPISQYAYPRYMKVQVLHEFLFKLIYVDDTKIEYHLPHGFASLVNVIPEITIEFAFGNISNMAMSDITHLRVDRDLLRLKLREAPPELYQMLLQSKSLQCSIRTNLKILAMLGLIQLVNHTSSTTEHNPTLSSYAFYLNRQAKILNTSGTWPRETDTKNLEKVFRFETFEDVRNYWNEVYEISTHTTIVHNNRGRKNLVPPLRKIEEVDIYDRGDVFGDGAGPCGFDSCFYMEHTRFWKAFYIRIIKNKPLIKKPIHKKKPVPEKKPRKIIKARRRRKPPKPRDESIMHPRIKVPQRRRCADPVVKWTKWDDTIINMCKVAVTILSPVAQPGCLKIRNAAARDLLGIFDTKKIASVCHRRATALELNMTLQHQKECLINELRRRRHLIVSYEGLLKKLRIKYCTNLKRFIREARIPMLELVWLINQLVENKSYIRKVPCVAMDIEDFYKRFKVSSTNVNRPFNLYRTDVESDLNLALVKETIILSIMMNFNSTPSIGNAKQVFAVLKEFPERTLRIGLDQLRKCGAVACINKMLNNHLHRLDIQDTVHASYKISAAYRRKWINRQNTDLPDLLADVLDSKMPQDHIKPSPEVNCLLCEFQSAGLLEIVSVTLPVITGPSGSIIHEQQLNVLDIEMKFKLKSGILGWKKIKNFEHFTDNFNIPLEELPATLHRQAILQKAEVEESVDDKIVAHLKVKGDKGALFSELLDEVEPDNSALIKRLQHLESKNVITRVGFYENRIVLSEFSKRWGIKLNDKIVVPTPWRTLNGDVRYEIFFTWSSVIINKVFELPGCTIEYLSTACEYLTTRAVQEICVFLEKCQCVTLKVLRTPEIDLFSDDVPSEFTEYNQFETPENIYVFPLKDALTKYAFVRKRMYTSTRQRGERDPVCP